MRNMLVAAASVIASLLAAPSVHAQAPLGTAFTYQGELVNAGTLATGPYDLRFRLYDSPIDGTQVGSTLCSDNIPIAAGRFTVSLDFGAAFNGQQRFLEIQVREDAGLDCSNATGYTVLSPRQELTSTPHASFALIAGSAATAETASNATSLSGQPAAFYRNASNLTGRLPSGLLSGTYTGPLALSNPANVFSGDGAGLTNLSASNLIGTLDAARIPSLDAAKIASGTLDAARIPGLDAAKIASGTLADARLSANVALLSNPGASQFAGSLGIGLAPSAAARFSVLGGYDPTAVDQSQLAFTGAAGARDQWQSLTAAVTGRLTGVRLRLGSPIFGSTSPGTIEIYAGEGTGGQLLATQAVTYAQFESLQQFDFSSPPNITAGSVYTIRFAAPAMNGSWVPLSSINPYAGGRYSAASNVDVVFQTLVSRPREGLRVSDSGVVIGSGVAPPAVDGLSVSGASVFGAGVTAQSFTGSGSGLTDLNAAAITTGTLDAARIPNLDAVKITAGTLNDARLSGNIPRLNASNTFTGAQQTFSGQSGISVPNGVIQRGGTPVTGTTDLGLYSSNPGTWIRFVTNNAQFAWFGDSGAGTTARMTLSPTGNLSVVGSLSKGGGSFKIDHPLDPENKYLYHSFVESPDMMNIYNGNVTTDAQGYAAITLPDYFEALNRDFRYQLTVIDEADVDDAFIWAKVVEKIRDNQFTLRTSRGGVEVSWQVTGIRKDAWAEKNRIPNSVDKPAAEKGKLLHPEAFGKPAGPGVRFAPVDDSQPVSR